MKKTRVNISIFVPLILMVVVLAGFVIYRLGPFPTIPIRTWKGLTEASNLGEEITLTNYDLSYNLMVVSKAHPLDEDMVPTIVEYRETGVDMADIVTESYGRLSDYIRENMDDTLYIESSYRSFEDQARIYSEEGAEIAALPGCSEHQSGLALDVYVMYFGGSAFINSNTGKFVNSSCGEFGFIIRYPLGSENITGFSYEPWHIRYVGMPHSRIIMDNKLTLEEYIDSLQIGTWYTYDNYLICRQQKENLTIPSKYKDCEINVSADNMGYYIVTVTI